MQLKTAPAQDTRAAEGSSQAAEELHAAVSDLVRVYQFRDRDKICCYDVSVTQCYALEVLAEKGPMRSLTLAEHLRLDKSTVTRVVDALERKGYVERKREADDSRALALAITSPGRALYQKINGELIAQQAELLADLDPEMRAAAADVIRRLARAAEARFKAGISAGPATGGCRPGECC